MNTSTPITHASPRLTSRPALLTTLLLACLSASLNAQWVSRTVTYVAGRFGDLQPSFGCETGLFTSHLGWGEALTPSLTSYLEWQDYDSDPASLDPFGGLGQTVSPGGEFLAGYVTFRNGFSTAASTGPSLSGSLIVNVLGWETITYDDILAEEDTWAISIKQTPDDGLDPLADADYIFFTDFPQLGSFRVFEGKTTRVPVYAAFGSIEPTRFGEAEDPSAGVIMSSIDPISQNRAPVCDVRGPYLVEWAGAGTTLQLDGGGSSDPDGDALTYTWLSDCPGAVVDDPTSATPMLTFDAVSVPSVWNLTLVVTDSHGMSSTSGTTITIQDTTPPTLGWVTATPHLLWPPDHRMTRVTINADGADLAGQVACKILAVISNEPASGSGNGDQSPDWEITGDLTLNLRSECSSTGRGRVYTITLECTDSSGNVTSGTVNVSAPHDQRKK
jgi:hypothetical protein